MKVQCEQCAAAYSVADDKIAGRKLKQRCRKCGAPMVIDGTTLAPHDTPLAVPSAASIEAVWHIAVGDTTQGPYTIDELAQYYADGSIVLDTLVCRDGWNDWRPAGEIPELLHPAPPPPMLSVPPPALGHAVTMGRDPFADAAELSPRVSNEELGTPGMQRDGTVQFSMDQMRALSAVSSPSVPPPSATLPGHAAADDSGLIDVRALAEAEAKAAAQAAQAALTTAGGPYRALTPSQIGPLQGWSPVALHAPNGGALDFKTKVLASVAAFAFVLSGAVAVTIMLRSNDSEAAAPVPAAAPLPQVAAAAAAPAAAPALPAMSAAKPSTTPAAADGDARDDDEASADAREGGARKRGARGGRKERGDGKRDADKGSDVDDVIAASSTPKKSSGGSSIDDLLEGAINGKRAAPKEEPKEASSSLPQTPSRDAMLAALAKAKAKAGNCKGSGVATAAISVAGKTGKARSVSVSGVDGAAKSCVERAVRSTPFPRFQKDSFEVKFPFKLGA